MIVEWLVALLLVAGAAFSLVGSLALARLSSFDKRLHGPGKAGTLGVGCTLAASALWFGVQGTGGGHELLVLAFLFASAPAASHLLLMAVLKLRPPPD